MSNSIHPVGFAAGQNKSIFERGPVKPATPGGSLPTTDPTHGGKFWVTDAMAVNLHLVSLSSIQAYVGLDASANYTFDPNNRAVAQASVPSSQQPFSLPATVDASGRVDNTAQAGAQLNLVA